MAFCKTGKFAGYFQTDIRGSFGAKVDPGQHGSRGTDKAPKAKILVGHLAHPYVR